MNQRDRITWVFKIVLFTAAFLIVIRSCGPFLGLRNPLMGQKAPEFSLPTLKGAEMTLSQVRDKDPAMIFFWATWCPHCRIQLRELAAHRLRIESEGIKIVLVNVGESPAKVSQYIDGEHLPFETFLDQDRKLTKVYHLVGVPTFILVNDQGGVVGIENALPGNYEEILLNRTGL